MFDQAPISWLAAGSALAAICCYALFSRRYEPLTRKAHNTLYAATILYAAAGMMLAGITLVSLVAVLVLGWHASAPTQVTLAKFTLSDPLWIGVALGGLVVAMTAGYALHIGTEAASRKRVNMGTYTLVFQVYALVIALLDWLVYRTLPGVFDLIGGACLLCSSIGIIAVHYRGTFAAKHGDLWRRAIWFCLASAGACGAALFIDGEVGRHYIFRGSLSPALFPAFFFYECLTFALPATVTFALLCRKYLIKSLISDLWKEYRQRARGYHLAALFSVGQFVFSVFALALPGSRFIVAMILAGSPLLTVSVEFRRGRDYTKQYRQGRKLEYIMAGIGGLGLLLINLHF